MTDVTAILLNWRRPEGCSALAQSLREQSVPIDIWIWDNSGSFEGEADLVVRSGDNLGCFPRLHLAALARSAYVVFVDDDMRLTSRFCIEEAVNFVSSHEAAITGRIGKARVRQLGYRGPEVVPEAGVPLRADIVKGNVMVFRAAILSTLPSRPPPQLLRIDYRRVDDIWLCLGSMGEPWVLPALFEGVRDGPRDFLGLGEDKEHYWIRDRFTRACLNWFVDA